MKVAVNMRLPNGAEKTLVYGAKHVADAYTKAKEDHPTWDVIAVSAGRRGGREVKTGLKKEAACDFRQLI